MGLLNEVINAALASTQAGSGERRTENQPANDQFSQLATAITALLTPKPGAVPARQNPSGGLDVLINQFKQSGLGDVINSWIGTGKNEPVSSGQLRQALGQERISDLSRQAGAPQDELLSQLSKFLPGIIDRLTPNGQLPKEADLSLRPHRH